MKVPLQPAAVILAAGESRRMGSPKPLLTYEGETFLDRLIGIFAQHCSPVIAVLGYHAERVAAGIERSGEATLIHNPEPERGMLSSLQCGLAALSHDCPGVLFTPVDYPAIRPATVAALTAAFYSVKAPVIQPEQGGNRGHPVCVRRGLVEELLALPPGEQARTVIRRHREQAVYIAVDDPGIADDVDDPVAYHRLIGRA